MRKHRIHAQGADVPPPLASFDELFEPPFVSSPRVAVLLLIHSLCCRYEVNALLKRNLAALNWPTPTPIQMAAIPILLKVSFLRSSCFPLMN